MHLLAISVGNTRTRFGVFRGNVLDHSGVVENSDIDAVVSAIRAIPLDRPDTPAVMASVNDPVADRIAAGLVGPRGPGAPFRGRLYRFAGAEPRPGRDFPVPIPHALADASTVGQDRLLNALGAFARAGQACVVIDAGTAVTVDFVDGEGVFQGGAIAPGVNMMLRSLHEHTAALPALRYHDASPPPSEGQIDDAAPNPFGKSTEAAMLTGVRSSVVGMARLLVDQYAEYFGAYPRVIATGGDAQALFESDPIIEHIVPDLTLMGIHAACERLLEAGED